MEKEQRERWLFGISALLIVAIVLLSWADVPAFIAPKVTYQSGASAVTTTQTAVLKVSVNTGTVQELMQIDGLGETIAERIVVYRTEHGFFYSLDDLLKVDGIGEKRLAAWRPHLTL